MEAPSKTPATRNDDPAATTMLRSTLLACGIGSSLVYVAMNVIAALQFQGYSSVSQTVSELSAIGAPSRPVWAALGIVYNLLLIAFGWAVWTSARGVRALRVTGGLVVALGVIGFGWPPMHARGEGFSLTDTLHIVFTLAWVVLSLLTLTFGASAFGRGFRIYSIGTLVVQLGLGTWLGFEGRRVAQNLPTPWVGLVERINIGLFLLWIVVLAVVLMRRAQDSSSTRSMYSSSRPRSPVSRKGGSRSSAKSATSRRSQNRFRTKASPPAVT